MKLEVKKHLYDIQAASELIVQFIHAKSFADYEADVMLRSAIERQLMVVGEAFVRLRSELPEADEDDLLDRITDARKIIGFRNILVHGYDAIKNDIVWIVIIKDLPALIREVNTLLN